MIGTMTMNETHTPASVEFLPAENRSALPPEASRVTELTARESVFAQWFAETRNLVAAYKASYDVPLNATHRDLWGAAAAVAARPHVAAKVEEILERITAAGVIRCLDILRDLADIAETDPNELCSHVKDNCRHCHGTNYGYRWRDAAEFAQALDAYMGQQGRKLMKGEKRLQLPVADGGFGFKGNDSPNPGCPHCYGLGTERVILADTTKLSPKARKLLKGISQDRFGVVRFELHDQMQARDMINKMLGGYKNDGKGLPLTGQGALDGISLTDATDPRAVADAYLRMLSAPAKT